MIFFVKKCRLLSASFGTELEKVQSFSLAKFDSYTVWDTRKWRNKRHRFMNSSQKRTFTRAHYVRSTYANNFHDEVREGRVTRVLHPIRPASIQKTSIAAWRLTPRAFGVASQWNLHCDEEYAKGSHRNSNADASFTPTGFFFGGFHIWRPQKLGIFWLPPPLYQQKLLFGR